MNDDDPTLLRFRPEDGVDLIGFADAEPILREIWDAHFYDRHRPIVAGERVLDLGANQGFFSIYAARRGARVIAYEPEPAAFAMLARNLARCGLEGAVEARPRAVSAAEGAIDLLVPSAAGLCASGMATTSPARARLLRDVGVERLQTVRVASETLASVLERQGPAGFDLVKLDCEGAELEILRSALPAAFARVGALVMETHDAYPQAALYHAVQDLGFAVEAFDKLAGPFRTGYLFARRAGEPRAPRTYALLDGPRCATAGVELAFDASGSFSSHRCAPPERCVWSIDGAVVADGGAPALRHTFPRAGSHDVAVKTIDPGAAPDHASLHVWIFAPEYFQPAEATPLPAPGGELEHVLSGWRAFVIPSALRPRHWNPRRIIVGIAQLDDVVSGRLDCSHVRAPVDDRYQEIPLHAIPAGVDVRFSLYFPRPSRLKLAWWGAD